jgi:hypothetical protein
MQYKRPIRASRARMPDADHGVPDGPVIISYMYPTNHSPSRYAFDWVSRDGQRGTVVCPQRQRLMCTMTYLLSRPDSCKVQPEALAAFRKTLAQVERCARKVARK